MLYQSQIVIELFIIALEAQVKDILFSIMELVGVVRCGLISMMLLTVLISTLLM